MAAKLHLKFDSVGSPVAEIGLEVTYGNLHRPALTLPCETIDELVAEIHSLREQLDRIQTEAKRKFSEAESKTRVRA